MADSGRSLFRKGITPRPATAALLALALQPAALQADTPLSLVSTRALSFGSFAVMGTAVRQVGADGSVTGSGLMAIRGSVEGPAEYAIEYRASLPVVVLNLTMGAVAPVTINGARGTLDNFVTDLPGVPTLTPGQGRTFVVPNCGRPTCSLTFRVGARLTVSGGTGGGTYVFPLPLSLRAIAGN